MASNGSMLWRGHSRGGLLLDAGGVLSISGGVVELTAGAIVLGIVGRIMIGGPLPTIPHIPWMPSLEIQLVFFPARFMIVGIIILIFGGIGIAGGISAVRRKSFGVSFAGAICTLPTVLFGIMAVIFVALSKREFGAEAKENSITSRNRLLTVAGILSIIGGEVEVMGAVALVSYGSVTWWPVTGGLLLLGFLSIIGGILAVRRKGYKAALAGAIGALPTVIFGALAIWFIFDAEAKESGITSRSGLLTAGVILSIMGGEVEVIGALVLVVYFWDAFRHFPIVTVAVVILLLLGSSSIRGGILALRRKNYKASLDGAFGALPTVIFGALAIWFISGRECEFGAQHEVLW
ncbi:MAG: hypothetical protein JSW22_02530 [Chloroflexota bacterium]|nr:MAG: hypothetical protein JSW22_02530 [Chloroflexota bacterium]